MAVWPRSKLLLPMVLLGIVAGCAETSSSGDFTLSDSAGVTIATSHAAPWGEGEGWRLPEEPLVTIGVEEGPEEYELFRVGSAVRLEDGRIVVANLGTLELRFYGPDGVYLFSRGGEGDGPGEFRSMLPIWPLGDSLFVFDSRLMRLTVYSTAGDLARTAAVQLAPGGSIPVVSGSFSDGHLLARVFSLTGDEEVGLKRDLDLYVRYTPDGEFADSVGLFPGSERYLGREGDATFSTDAPFGRGSTVLPVGHRLYFGSSDSYEIRILARDGSLERIIRRPIPNPPVTEEEARKYSESLDERMDRMAPMWRRLHANVELPASKPAYGRILADSEGNLWVSDWVERRSALSPDEGTWVVFDSEGRMLGEVETPPRFRVLQIGGDWLLGVSQDELEVERVQLFEIIKG